MKIKIIKEKQDMYFAQIIGRSDIYAQGPDATQAVDNLIDIYHTISEFRASQKQSLIEVKKDYHTRLPKLQFKSLNISL